LPAVKQKKAVEHVSWSRFNKKFFGRFRQHTKINIPTSNLSQNEAHEGTNRQVPAAGDP